MYEVRQYSSLNLPPELACQIVSFFRLDLADQAKGEDRFWDPLAHSYEVPMQHFVITERGILISHADVTERTIIHEGESYRVFGIGEVLTYPVFRGEGHGRRVIEAATAYIHASDADVGMLFTAPELAGFYGENGWFVLGEPGITFGDEAQPNFDDAFVMMLLVSEKGKANHAAFERGPIYVGKRMW